MKGVESLRWLLMKRKGRVLWAAGNRLAIEQLRPDRARRDASSRGFSLLAAVSRVPASRGKWGGEDSPFLPGTELLRCRRPELAVDEHLNYTRMYAETIIS